MPRASVHRTVGAVVGGAAAATIAQDLPADVRPAFVLGGAVGGLIGGALPDLLEPPTSSHHRDLAHAWAVLVGTISLRLDGARGTCLAWADECARRAAGSAVGSVNALWWQVVASLLRALAGALHGVQAGYVSHLTLDACTATGLPLVCR